MRILRYISHRFFESYTLDVRALSLMRIGVGLVLLTDLIIRSFSIEAFFTNQGIIPVHILKQYNWNSLYFSFHALTGDLWWQVLLFIINGLALVLLIIGYRTRLFTFICWAFLVSVQTRNPFILQGGDDLMRLILLWGIFLPWGERYSVLKTSPVANSYFSVANIGYILLIASVYYFSALLKTSAEWRTEGTAIYYALSLDQLRMPFGTLIYQYPWLMKAMTHVVFYIELLAPLLLVVPFLPYWLRLTGLVGIFLLHLGIASTVYVGLFYAIGIVTLIGMLPTRVMNWFEKKWYRNHTVYVEEINTTNGSLIAYVAGILKNSFIIMMICYCLMINLGNVRWFPYMLDQSVHKFGQALRLEQSWGMFAPFILKDDGFFVYAANTTDGKFFDIKHQKDTVLYSKPEHVVCEYESDRWRKFGENYVFNNNNYLRPYYCDYLLRKWNRQHPEKPINELTIFFMKETSLPGYQVKPLEKKALCNCHDTDTFPRYK